MTNVLDNYRDAKGTAVQPYFAAFMIERGYAVAAEPFDRDGSNIEYMQWNWDRWREFNAAHGFKADDQRFHRVEFGAWLAARALDHIARNHVEALAA